LYKDLANSHDELPKPAYTPFLDETGDEYGLGGGMCEEAPDGARSVDAYMDIERTLRELARNVCVGVEQSGFRSYGYDFDDVEDCHASIYGNLTERTLP
jgi:hypothetical protein